MRTVWLASYPKSGNTWFRLVAASLAAGEDGADINALSSRGGGLASARAPFDSLLMIESGLFTHGEIDRLRPCIYAALARGPDGLLGEEDDDGGGPQAVRFVKIHDAYTVNAQGEALMGGARGADGAILIVRDPRDMAASLANHNNSSVDAAIDYMASTASAMCRHDDRQGRQLRQRLLDWSGHAASWLDQRDIPVHLMRYEDMLAEPLPSFRAALAFARHPADDADIARAVRLADFTRLQGQEKENRFCEAPPHLRARGGFFRQGQAGRWREELTPEQVARIEAAHAPMMQRLGYALSQPAAASGEAA